MDKETMQTLSKWRLYQNKILAAIGHPTMTLDQLVFSNPETNSLYAVSAPAKWLSVLLKNFNMKKITPHGFRHTHATLLFETGVDVKEVQARFGHANSQTTLDIYTHITESRQHKTADKFSTFMSN
ncbi:hypothetical protein FC36_GL000322 [Ligilactobacillus equi DSM 15833 = JCM 10991]|uniref:Tyr recombinase domain-containing protein n=1 Tax=Ligilactobacillus equi DSM 15833 = JCM 10991 TaxID=1423740 RepID=A0A0R1TPA1_9LACO|nr:site-specific integrase [Ligilactobacillus equi]KRL83279.1 hypothetical protein FC36_GL000322 [Ligilactobacillus equi DSM 15833 = JCM 10991]